MGSSVARPIPRATAARPLGVLGIGFRVSGSGIRLGFRVQGLGLGLGFRDLAWV